MKRLLFIFASASMALAAGAQETYENANIATEDLNGTARYVGMGGAMDALGADLSTIGTNPAGIGMFRHSTANVSFGFASQQDAADFSDHNKTNMSFDQIGFVYSRRSGHNSFFNVAFNYHKSRDFNQILSAAGTLNGASQNKLSSLKGYIGVFDDVVLNNGTWTGVSDYGNGMEVSSAFNQVDYLYYNTMPLCEECTDASGQTYTDYGYFNGSDYLFDRATKGYIGNYDFNISGNINDRVYLGLTFGISDVHYKGFSQYTEALADNGGVVDLYDERRITGTGFNVKAGIIFRPIETSPFRVGLSVATPTWYDLTSTNSTTMNYLENLGGTNPKKSIGESYDFKLYTPWKFGVSLGTIVGNYLALGAVYEYSDYGNLDSRINTGGGYDYWGGYYDSSESDVNMNDHTDYTLKGVHTVKLGLEYKPYASLAIRLGYNYVSPMYNKDGFKDGSIESPGTYYSSSTDFTNWRSTNRITCGIGYNVSNFSFDLAYQYSVQNGDFSPFMSYRTDSSGSEDLNNVPGFVEVNNKRHQVLFTLGYHF